MSVVGGAVPSLGRTVVRAVDAATAAAGAVGGAAVDGVVGGVKGVAAGVKRGIGEGSHSTPAAALAIGALGITGLVEWPVLLAVGGGALLLRQLNHRQDGSATSYPPLVIKYDAKSVKSKPTKSKPTKSAAAKSTSTKSMPTKPASTNSVRVVRPGPGRTTRQTAARQSRSRR